MKTAKIELHLHLDGSLNLKWAYYKALQREVIPEKETFEEFYDRVFAINGSHSALSITKFDLMCDLLQYREDLFDATYDLARRLYEMGIVYAEIRFASQHHCKKGLSQYDAVKAVVDGAKKAMEDYPIKIGIINCLMHKGDSAAFNYKENLETITASEELYKHGLVGLDLAGFENNCEYSEYAPLFKIAKEKGFRYTLHAGEMGSGAHILDALAMEPERIGHGINCIQDDRYIEALLERDMPLEVCVTSNIKTTMNYASHPVRKMLERGLKVTLNTDNMVFSKSNLINEHYQLKMLGVSDDTLMKCTYNALDAAFCDEDTKEYLRKII
ncbi:MAG: adenosine deaminase [Erysipelotrichaceae bacterium]|nr:adenosine deaminase [Erysipelotrichaceae bacterium]